MTTQKSILVLVACGALAAACGPTEESTKTPDAGTDAAVAAMGGSAAGGSGGGSGGSAATPEAQALAQVKSYISENLEALVKASTDLQAAAPAADDDGWSAAADKPALDAMQA